MKIFARIITLLVLVLFLTIFEADACNQQTQLRDYDKKPTRYSAVPAKGEFQNQSSELASDQERRVVRESRYKSTYPEITDPAGNGGTEPGEDSVVQISDYAAALDPFPSRHPPLLS